MSLTQQYAKERAIAKAQFTRAINAVSAAILPGSDVLPTTIENRYTVLRESWAAVQEKHNKYMNSMEDENEKEDQWIEKLADQFESKECEIDKYFDLLKKEEKKREKELEEQHVLNEQEKLQEKEHNARLIKQNIQKQRDLKIRKTIEKLDELIKSGDNGTAELVESAITENLTSLEDDMKACTAIQEDMASSDQSDLKWYSDVIDAYNDAKSSCKIFQERRKQIVSEKRTTSVKFEKIRFEQFDGDIRKYSRFKEEFQKHVKTAYDKDEEAFVLKSHLAPHGREEVEACGDETSAIWERLDTKYGDEGKLVDLIISEIDHICVIGTRNENMLRFVDIVEKGYRDLKRLSKESELNNSTIVALIERKLPMRYHEEWIQRVNGKDRIEIMRNKFEHLLDFMIEIRRRIEYTNCEIRREDTSRLNELYGHRRYQKRRQKRNYCQSMCHTQQRCSRYKRLQHI